jgi:hypothetical protein
VTSQVYVTTNYFVDSKNQCFLTKMKTICSSKRKLFSVDHQNRVNMHHNPHCKNNSLLILLIKTPCNMSSCTTKKKKKKDKLLEDKVCIHYSANVPNILVSCIPNYFTVKHTHGQNASPQPGNGRYDFRVYVCLCVQGKGIRNQLCDRCTSLFPSC